MLPQPFRVDDPRDNLQKATRFELVEFARQCGLNVKEDSPALATIALLRKSGFTQIKIPERPLGQIAAGEVMTTDDAVATVNADDLLIAQYEQEKQVNPDQMSMNELRSAIKAAGIKASRRDNLQSLRQKLKEHLGGKDAA